jgi:SAM-dependent methyltransferase
MEEDALVKEQIEYYRAQASDYDVTSSLPRDPLAIYVRQIEKALDEFRPTGRVLEIASGTGGWTVHLLRYASSITAVDSSSEMHDRSRRKLGADSRVRYLSADAFSWNPDGRYDVVFFANWLSHVPPGRLCRFWGTVRAALAPAGRVFFVDELEDAWAYDERFRETFRRDPSLPIVLRSVPDGRTFHVSKVFWNPEELRSTLRAMGWEVEVHTAGPFFWAEAKDGDHHHRGSVAHVTLSP